MNKISFKQFINEALTAQQRTERRNNMRKNMSKIKAGKKRMANKKASKDTINSRAISQAKTMLIKKWTGKTKNELSFSEKAKVEAKLKKSENLIKRIAKKLLKSVKEKEQNKNKEN